MIKGYLSSTHTAIFLIGVVGLVFLSLETTKQLVKATTSFEEHIHIWIAKQLRDESLEDERVREEKSSRVLLQVIRALPSDLLGEISPESM